MAKRVRIIVHGRVQGVGFRAYSEATAARLGLTGYVTNRTDGTVEIVVDGEDNAVDQLVARARSGPPMARVDRIEVETGEPEGAFEGFGVRF